MESRYTFRKFMSSVMLDWENSPLSWEGTKTSWWDELSVLWEDVSPRNIPQFMLTFIEYILPLSLVPWLLCFHLMKGSLGMVTFIFWHKMTYEKNTPIVHRALGKVVLGVETVLFNLEFFQVGGEEVKEVWGRGRGKREGRKGGWKRSVPCGCLSPAVHEEMSNMLLGSFVSCSNREQTWPLKAIFHCQEDPSGDLVSM